MMKSSYRVFLLSWSDELWKEHDNKDRHFVDVLGQVLSWYLDLIEVSQGRDLKYTRGLTRLLISFSAPWRKSLNFSFFFFSFEAITQNQPTQNTTWISGKIPCICWATAAMILPEQCQTIAKGLKVPKMNPPYITASHRLLRQREFIFFRRDSTLDDDFLLSFGAWIINHSWGQCKIEDAARARLPY